MPYTDVWRPDIVIKEAYMVDSPLDDQVTYAHIRSDGKVRTGRMLLVHVRCEFQCVRTSFLMLTAQYHKISIR